MVYVDEDIGMMLHLSASRASKTTSCEFHLVNRLGKS